MIKKMYNITVSTGEDLNINIEQELHDLNEPDPVITISPGQAGLVASWIIDAATKANRQNIENESIPITFVNINNGPSSDLEELKVHCNNRGMIILSINEDTYIEISPIMAKRLREQLSQAISITLTDMLLGDDEV